MRRPREAGNGSRPAAVALFGPTGTGKTALACAIADRIPCRLISCDALQVYRGLEAAVAKPAGAETRHPWRLIDVVEPEDDFNAGRFARAAAREIDLARREGRIPLVVGGTGLYLRALLKGLDDAPTRDDALRARLDRLQEKHGERFLHRVLTRLDPAAGNRLSHRDGQRVERALEVLLSGGSVSSRRRWDGLDRFRALRIGLELPRAVLNERLDARVSEFFGRGLIAEVRELTETRGLSAERNAMRAIGYREVVRWLSDVPPMARDAAERDPPPELVDEVRKSTRRYAKRQMTWFRKETPATWHDPRDPELAARLASVIESWWREESAE